MTGQRKPRRNTPYKWFKLLRARDSLSLPMCLSTSTPFPPNEHFTRFTTFHVFVGIHFYKANKPRALSPPLIPGGLVSGIQHSHCRGMTSISGQGTEILLQAATGRGHPRSAWPGLTVCGQAGNYPEVSRSALCVPCNSISQNRILKVISSNMWLTTCKLDFFMFKLD